VGKDLRDIEAHAADGDDNCRLAMAVFAHRLRKYIGAYAAVMGGVDAIVFTGGIGENSAGMRQRVAQRLDFLGARLDDDRNRDALVDHNHRVASIGAEHGRCQLLVVASDEAWAIATDVAKVAGAAREEDAHEIPVAISARHVHLTQEAVDALFGPGHSLTPERPLTQPGQFAAVERLTLVGPKRNLEGVRIIGPVRSACQVEISRTDEYHLGLDAPIRCSGDLDNTPGITLRGTGGDYAMTQGVIQSQRHIHMTPDDAAHFGVGHKEIVEVAVNSEGRDLVFRDVVVRVKDSYKLEMHVDTDEGNAAEVTRDLCGVLIETRESVRMRRR
jgi:acetate kinase